MKIVWTGDLDDDCTAHYKGYTLRAEYMGQGSWWWAVTKDDDNMLEIGQSWEDGKRVKTGKSARQLAEKCLEDYLIS